MFQAQDRQLQRPGEDELGVLEESQENPCAWISADRGKPGPLEELWFGFHVIKSYKELSRAESNLCMRTKCGDRSEFTERQQEATENLGPHGSDLDPEAGGANGEQKLDLGLVLKIESAEFANGNNSQRDIFSQSWFNSVLFSCLPAPAYTPLGVFGFKTKNPASSYTLPLHLS